MVDQQRDASEETLQPPAPEKFNEKIRRGYFWVVQYWRELFNFKFDKYMIIQVMPGVYGIALTAIAMGLLYLCVEAFMASTWRGIFYFFFAAPLTFLVAASVLRALLEFYMVVFKISEHVDELVGLRDTVDRLSGISDSVDEMVAVTRRIPFWRALSGSRPRPEKKAPAASHKDEKK
ncbi:DUF4282 domain-containing protein [Alcanivorax sp.]|uniref:DUF4282 domain-containing protein n=1 Tax=Alcanivorax sp. TaxID=1872427 RepID=UPI000C62E3EA|nr:DUF4282 domain-containing protein [Alcanivorax sp.]MBQ25021.1 hypothetical protein [Alcanivorax sp.]|tara:strand:+ start:1019 stop:1549 length:531 start_codon:yes stop_codon:yes gene_type:complete